MRGSDKAVSDYMRLWAVCEVDCLEREHKKQAEKTMFSLPVF